VTAGLGALGDDEVDPGGLLAAGVLGRADQGRDHDVTLVGAADQVGRGRAEGAGHQPDRVIKGDVEQATGGLGRDAERTGAGREVPGELGDTVAGQQVIKEGLVAGRET
jgi:hypothetical protein